jgi:signal transduction histidine kinase
MISLYPSLILVGVTILAVMVVLLIQSSRHARVNLDLLRLNETLCFDLPDSLRKSWPQLARAGFTGLSWQLDWFGTSLAGEEGIIGKAFLNRHLEVGEIALDVTLFHGGRRWEQRYFSDSLAENFFLLLHMNMWIKMGAVQGAFDQAAKLELFLQHDMKNIFQFIRLAAEQLEDVKPEHEARLLTTLRSTMPTVRVRAERILGTLSRNAAKVEKCYCRLAEVWQQAVDLHGLTARIQGDPTVFLAEAALHSIIDNLVVNYVDQALRTSEILPCLQISLSQEHGKVTATIQDIQGRPCPWPERLFEPFWSEQREGLGIGLYQARQLAEAAGGSLDTRGTSDLPLIFVLTLPAAKSRPMPTRSVISTEGKNLMEC